MPSQHKNPLLGWRPPAELSAWARDEAERQGGKDALSALLTEALERERARRAVTDKAVTTSPRSKKVVTASRRPGREPVRDRPATALDVPFSSAPDPCPHPKQRVLKGL